MQVESTYIFELFSDFDETTSEFLQIVESFSEEELNRVPYKNSWTAAQIAEHVTRSNITIIQSMQIEGKKSTRELDERVPELKATFLDFNIQLNSPDFILPTQTIYHKESLVKDLERSISRLRELSKSADFSEALNHPAFGEITKLEIFHFVLYHTQRHIHQLRKVIDALKSKKSSRFGTF